MSVERTCRFVRLIAVLLGFALGCGGTTVQPVASTGVAPRHAPATSDTIEARVLAVADAYMAAHDARPRDHSAATEQAWRAREDRWLAELRALDGQVPLGHPAWVIYGLLRNHLESRVALRVCRNRLWMIHPLTGWQSEYAVLAAQQPADTPELRARALARWSRLPGLIDQELAGLREGEAQGYTAPKSIVYRVLADLDRLLTIAPSGLPFFSSMTPDSTSEFHQEIERLVTDRILPAVQRYRDYLATEYLAVAREDVAITANPDGAACYRAAVRRYTTLDLSGEELHRQGLAALAVAESTLIALVMETNGDETSASDASRPSRVRGAMRRLRFEPGGTFPSRAAMRAAIDTILERAWAAAPRWFNRLPKSNLIVTPIASFQEGSAPGGQYLPPAADGSRPGVFQVNLQRAIAPGIRFELEETTFHEAVPGHHFQLGLARERPGAHPVTRRLGTTAFAEGWAVYAEHLADEMGLYSSPVSRLYVAYGAVSALAGLVAETGLHVRGWSRSEAIEFLMMHTTMSQSGAAAAVDRRAGWPGQGLSYVVGYLEIRRLRELAERELGARFDIREFHDRVLEDGTITLPMLREKIEAWVRRRRAASVSFQ